MATKKKDFDFTAADRDKYAGIIGAVDATNTTKITNITKAVNTKNTTGTKTKANTKNTKNTKTTESTTKTTRQYNRLDPREEAPEEYRFTVRMPGEYGRFMNELAYQRRSTITAEFQRLVAEEIEKHPEILESLDELNK